MKLIIVSQIDACPTPDLPSSFARTGQKTQLEFDRSVETGVNDLGGIIAVWGDVYKPQIIESGLLG